MALVTRGEQGEPHKTRLVVVKPEQRLFHEDLVLAVSVTEGQEVRIKLPEDEALQLLADIAAQLATRLK
jgi:hypothetical protein